MSVYKVSLEIGKDGWCMAHVPELPGCFVKVPSRTEALKALPTEIADYLNWLRQIGEKAPPKSEPIKLEVTETFQIPRKVADGQTLAAFDHDLKPITKKELEKYLKLLKHSRQRLIKLLETIEAEFGDEIEKLFRWRPDEESNSLGEILGHIVRAEAWYLARLAKKIDHWSHYTILRQLTIDRLRRLTPEERKRKTVHLTYDSGKEIWTVRKVMRRALWHERYHICQIEEILKKYKSKNEPRRS